jgi:hypothetical protein
MKRAAIQKAMPESDVTAATQIWDNEDELVPKLYGLH